MNTAPAIDLRYKAGPAWDTHRAVRVERCIACRTCYPDRYLAAADIIEGVCGTCRKDGAL